MNFQYNFNDFVHCSIQNLNSLSLSPSALPLSASNCRRQLQFILISDAPLLHLHGATVCVCSSRSKLCHYVILRFRELNPKLLQCRYKDLNCAPLLGWMESVGISFQFPFENLWHLWDSASLWLHHRPPLRNSQLVWVSLRACTWKERCRQPNHVLLSSFIN